MFPLITCAKFKSLQSLGRELSNDVKIGVDHVDMVGLMMKADIAAAHSDAWLGNGAV